MWSYFCKLIFSIFKAKPNTLKSKLFLVLLTIFLIGCGEAIPPHTTDQSHLIRINQEGYYTESSKVAIIVDSVTSSTASIVDLNTMVQVYETNLSESKSWQLAGEEIRLFDFSEFQEPGTYAILVDGMGYSYPFSIGNNVLSEAFKASVKSLYHQRVGMATLEKHAGMWAREMGHPDDSVTFHPSTGRSGISSSPGGWYDAGDYGKYVVNGAFPLGQMLALYEQYPNILEDGALNIPESGNGISDFLDELKYEMDWLLTMQDDDGGLFFKLTTADFEGMIMPAEAKKTRWLIGKSTTATLDFAAVAAKTSRIFRPFDADFAENCLNAAQKAWEWALENPSKAFSNPEDISTGEYGDKNFTQEFFWAASELFISTGEEAYKKHLLENPLDLGFEPGESWANFMHYIGVVALLDNLDSEDPLHEALKEQMIRTADALVAKSQTNDYLQPIDDFQWGSNSDIFNSAMLVAQAYRLTRNPTYLETVLQITDYIFGKNAVGYCFLTGFGSQNPKLIHHRPSSADGVEDPVPGFVVGGPNSRMQDANEVTYPENVAPMKAWADQEPSYASNEVCLNWNSAGVYVLGFIEQEMTAKK